MSWTPLSMSVLLWVAAIGAALLIGTPAAAQAQAAANLSCEQDRQQPKPGENTASAPSGPQCWEGTLKTHAQGNMYNDTADGKFKFSVAADGTVNGTAHIRMSHAPQTMPGGCVYTRS